jgi:hypothetical protein
MTLYVGLSAYYVHLKEGVGMPTVSEKVSKAAPSLTTTSSVAIHRWQYSSRLTCSVIVLMPRWIKVNFRHSHATVSKKSSEAVPADVVTWHVYLPAKSNPMLLGGISSLPSCRILLCRDWLLKYQTIFDPLGWGLPDTNVTRVGRLPRWTPWRNLSSGACLL